MRTPLQPPPGINGDDTAFSKSGSWWKCKNVRPWRNSMQIVGGWEQLAGDLLSGVCRNIFTWTDAEGTLHVAFGTHSHLQVWKDQVLYDITPAGLAAGNIDTIASPGYGTGTYGTGDYSEPQLENARARTWSLAAWGTYLLANPRGGGIFQWELDTSAPAAALTNAPTDVVSMLVAAQDQVFALGCNEEVSGNFNPLCIRHSGVRANTVWNTGPDTTAREYILPGGGRIVAGRAIGPNLLIWTTHALFLGTYIGQPGQVWRFDRVGEKCGLVAPNAVVVVDQSAYWLGPDLQFRQYSLGGAAQLVPCPIREDMADNVVALQVDKIVASSSSKFGEIRVDYPDARDGEENSRYVAVSLINPAWYRGDIARTAMVDAGPQELAIGATADGHTYWHESGETADGGPISWEIETADQPLDPEFVFLLRQIEPDIAAQVGPISVTVTTRMHPQGEETVYGPYTMATEQGRVDVLAAGRIVRLKFSGSSAPASARFGRILLDWARMGRR
jgi:hypothetical protein